MRMHSRLYKSSIPILDFIEFKPQFRTIKIQNLESKYLNLPFTQLFIMDIDMGNYLRNLKDGFTILNLNYQSPVVIATQSQLPFSNFELSKTIFNNSLKIINATTRGVYESNVLCIGYQDELPKNKDEICSYFWNSAFSNSLKLNELLKLTQQYGSSAYKHITLDAINLELKNK